MSKTLAAILLVLCPGPAFSQQAATNLAAPLSLLLLRPDQPAPDGVRSGPSHPNEAIFLVTNHTAKSLVVNISGVEVKSGSNWLTQLRPHGPLNLSATNAIRTSGATNAFIPGLTTTELGPHQAAYSTVSFSGLP